MKNRGFTIVELLIVIVVIAILAAVTVVSYRNISASAKDSERLNDINAVSKALAQYRIVNGHYPRYDDMVSNTLVWVKANMKWANVDSFKAPGGTDANSFANSTAPAINTYSYRVFFTRAGVQRECTQAQLNVAPAMTVQSCDRYELRWRSQQNNQVQLLRSRYGW